MQSTDSKHQACSVMTSRVIISKSTEYSLVSAPFADMNHFAVNHGLVILRTGQFTENVWQTIAIG